MNTFNITGNIVKVYDNVNHVKVVVADNYITEQGEKRVNFIPICVFGKRAEFVKNYIKIGDHIQATGRVGTYKSNTGAEHITLMSSDLSFCGYKNPHKKAEKEEYPNIPQGGGYDDDLPWG